MSSLSEVEHLQIPLQDILSATNNFDEKNFIAMGGFGSVYQGQSDKYGTIAVKRLSVGSDQGQHEFAMEIKLLSAYKHENLASLVGFCDQDGQKILVYKLESKGSLDKLLESKDLNWIQRLRICLDAAHGLKYLHNDVGPQRRVVHRDIKSANILLDDKLKAKISDFGLSKINPVNGPFTILISNACGTIGYVDPEYVIYGVLTENSDVYSFGVVLFEVLCGRPAQVVSYRDKRQFLCILAQNHYQKDTLDEIIDSDLRKQMNSASLTIFSTIAYQCLKSREDRPTITRVVEQLQKALDYQLLASSGLGRDARVSFRDQDVYNNILHRSRLTASSPSSSSPDSTLVSSSPSWNHDVFVNFHGRDVGENFVDHLYTALVQKGIHTYMDGNKMPEQCESLPPSFLKVIKESRIILVIFSNNYANSSWCLNELAYVMENRNETGQTVIPIFYEVDPLNVRKQIGAFGTTFAIHDSNVNKAESWRKALRHAASISGWDLKDVMNMSGSKFIKKIVDKISRSLLPSMLLSSVIGTTPIQDLKSQVQVGFGGVRMVGICGTWGSGKSSFAYVVYGEICHEFEGCCFVKNVRGESRMHGLKALQEKILSNILEPREVVVLESIEEGISMMKSRLRHTCVLIVLDDVDHLDHLEMLAGSQDWFGTGSRIIITTRNKNLLRAHNVNIIHNVRPLYTEEAIELFSRLAFSARKPVEGYEKLSRDMVSKSGGHPSTLVRLGSFLQGKDMREWRSTLARLEDLSVQEIVELFNPGDDGVVRRPW